MGWGKGRFYTGHRDVGEVVVIQLYSFASKVIVTVKRQNKSSWIDNQVKECKFPTRDS